jgi:hypothetical protein
LSREARNATFSGATNQAAYLLRENTGTSGVVQTAQTAVAALAAHDIPHLIVINLILRRKLPRDLPVAPAVRELYLNTWDALQAES